MGDYGTVPCVPNLKTKQNSIRIAIFVFNTQKAHVRRRERCPDRTCVIWHSGLMGDFYGLLYAFLHFPNSGMNMYNPEAHITVSTNPGGKGAVGLGGGETDRGRLGRLTVSVMDRGKRAPPGQRVRGPALCWWVVNPPRRLPATRPPFSGIPKSSPCRGSRADSEHPWPQAP